MDYIKARTYIDESHRFGGEMGLEAITCLLEKLGNPQDDLQFLHIAGTNGKGSVGAYLAAVLQEAGYRIGRFISPTLYEYRERIQINGGYIAEEAFGRLMDPVVKAIGELKAEQKPLPSPFEIETALSFLYYKEKQCDFVLAGVRHGRKDRCDECDPEYKTGGDHIDQYGSYGVSGGYSGSDRRAESRYYQTGQPGCYLQTGKRSDGCH